MVARRIPLGRRLKAWRGAFVNFLAVCASGGFAGVIYLQDSMTGSTVAVADVQTAPVRAPESARVATLSVKAGDKVEAGQVLAILEVPGLTQQIAAATANLEAARAMIDIQNTDRGRKYQSDISDARARTLSTTVSLQKAQSQLEEIQLEYARVTAPGVALPAAQVESVTARKKTAEDLVKALQSQLSGLKSVLDAAEGRAGGVVDPQLQAKLDALGQDLEALKAREEQETLKAPIAGIVSGALPPPGTWMTAGLELLTVSAPSTRQLVAWLPPSSVSSLKVGAAVGLQGPDGSVSATVEAVGPAVLPVPDQALTDPSRHEWKVPVRLQAEKDVLPGEVLVASF